MTDPIDEYLLGDAPAPRRLNSVQRATRRTEAIALRRAGVPVDAIAARLKVTPRTVYTWIRDALAAIPREAADELRALELDRLDALFLPQYRAALKGNTRAAETCLNIMSRRARMLGLDDARAAGHEAVGSLLDRLINGEA